MWEITGAEFSKSEMHTADGISIRFPRMTRIRDDKDWKSATNLHQLKVGDARPWGCEACALTCLKQQTLHKNNKILFS